MASKKAQLLEQAIQKDLHPFAARMSPTPFSSTEAPSLPEAKQAKKRPFSHSPMEANAQGSKGAFSQGRFDINHKNTEKRGYRFTKEEVWAIDDLRKKSTETLT